MMALAPDTALLLAWVAFAGVAIVGIVAVLVWAVRTGQFADQDRARYLPLESEIPDVDAASGRVREAARRRFHGAPQEAALPRPPAAAPTSAAQDRTAEGGPDDVQP